MTKKLLAFVSMLLFSVGVVATPAFAADGSQGSTTGSEGSTTTPTSDDPTPSQGTTEESEGSTDDGSDVEDRIPIKQSLTAVNAQGKAVDVNNLKYGDVLTVVYTNEGFFPDDKGIATAELHSKVIKLGEKKMVNNKAEWKYTVDCGLKPGAHESWAWEVDHPTDGKTVQHFTIKDKYANCNSVLAKTGTNSASLMLLALMGIGVGAATVAVRRFAL